MLVNDGVEFLIHYTDLNFMLRCHMVYLHFDFLCPLLEELVLFFPCVLCYGLLDPLCLRIAVNKHIWLAHLKLVSFDDVDHLVGTSIHTK